jgi:4-hydroxy-4-methyl-2-oxoglutarate aldolase
LGGIKNVNEHVSDRARFAAAGASGTSDAMERLGLPRTVITGFQCSAIGGETVVGKALTIRQVPKHYPSQAGARLVRHGELSAELAQKGDFVVVDAGGRIDIAGWGENHSMRCHERGVSGVLVNGGTRDIASIRRLGFPVFHLGASPVASRWDQETAEINGVVVVAGVQIKPGDLLVADEDGLIVIAPELVPQILQEITS